MKLSLEKRIQLSFFLAIALVAVIGIFSFYYMNQLNGQVQKIVSRDIALSHSSERIKANLFTLRRVERTYLISPETPLFHQSLRTAIEEVKKTAKEGEELCVRDDTKEKHQKIITWLEEYDTIIQETTIPFDPRELNKKLEVPWRKIRDIVDDLIQLRFAELEAHRQQAQSLSERSNRNIILMIVTTILAGLGLGLFAPSKVVLPFRKLFAAIQEVQAANFNVSVDIEGGDEIAELGHEFNKMIEEIRTFDDMKIKKIAFEKRKLDALSNMIDAGVVVLTVEGKIAYMNRQLYEILGLTTERILNTDLDEVPLSEELKEIFKESINRKERVEDRQWTFIHQSTEGKSTKYDVRISTTPVRNHVGDIVNFVLCLKNIS